MQNHFSEAMYPQTQWKQIDWCLLFNWDSPNEFLLYTQSLPQKTCAATSEGITNILRLYRIVMISLEEISWQNLAPQGWDIDNIMVFWVAYDGGVFEVNNNFCLLYSTNPITSMIQIHEIILLFFLKYFFGVWVLSLQCHKRRDISLRGHCHLFPVHSVPLDI